MRLSLFLFLFILNFSVAGFGQSAHELLMEGDDLYKNEQYDLAEDKYRKAKAKDKSGKAAYNLGNSLSRQERYEEAINQFSNAASLLDDPELKSKAYYNLGNTHFRNQKFQESVDAYKSALSYNEDDTQTKENLMMAKKMLQVQEQQQQQQQQDQQDQQEQQDQEQQENQDQQQEQDQNQPQEEQDQAQQVEETEKKDLDKEDARKLLEIIDNEEKKVQEKLRKMKGNSKKPKKDW